MSHNRLLYHIDLPKSGGDVTQPIMAVQGWVAFAPDLRLMSAALITNGAPISLNLTTRPDVADAFPGRATCGFVGHVDPLRLLLPPTMQFTFEGNVIDSCQLNFTINRAAIDDFEQAKCTKLIRINRIIRCPNCTSDLGAMVGGSIDCIPCNSSFRRGKYVFDFLDEGLRERGGVFEVENVSSNDYDPLTLAMIERYKDGLILDNGCGLRSVYYSNIVNFDIVPYHTTDVVGIGECLPFKDDSFDAIISVAVLEHVRDPFSAAREIERVLKPGGEAYIAVPFLQPFHGYPDHYYNMTSNGLRNLFKNLHEVSMDVPASGLPIWALSWILNAWASGLEKQDREAFLKLTVAQLAADPMSMLSQPFIKNLNASTNDRLACLNVLRAVKPPTDRAPR